MIWDPMTIDEFASYKQDDGMKLVKIDGVWWAEVRPFFFRPLCPFHEIAPWSKMYPPTSLLGGVLHLVPPHVETKSCINFHVYDDLKNYSLDIVSANRRKQIRRGIKNFTDRPITDLEEFVATAYDIYKIFYQRTNYWYKNNRTRREEFYAWAEKLYDYPKIEKTGIYLDNKLSAIVTSFQVEDIIFGDNLFSDNASLGLSVIDYIMHRFRESSASTDARYFFSGLPTGKETLDSSKLMRGCKLLRLPAYCKINPLALSLAKLIMKDSYHKLLTVLAQESEDTSDLQQFQSSQE
jgi:hypothetical protein